MRLHIHLIFSLTFFSCSSNRIENEKKVWEEWKGQPTSTLVSHPYLKNLPVKKLKNFSGIETWIFRDQSRFQSDSYCMSIGGCSALPFFNCDNTFSVKDGIILGLEQSGSCPGLKSIMVHKGP